MRFFQNSEAAVRVEKITLTVLLFLVSVFLSCISPPDFPPTSSNCDLIPSKAVLILNEGTFGNNEARLDLARIGEDSLSCVGIFGVKNSQELGDVAQEMHLIGNKLYVVVNNSHLIHELKFPSLNLSRTLHLPGGTRSSPRSMIAVNSSSLYITSLLDTCVYVVDRQRFSVSKRLILGNYPEGIAVSDGKAFVCLGSYVGTSDPRLAVIDTEIDSLLGIINLPLSNPGAIAARGLDVWVACRGDFLTTEKRAGLIQIDAVTGAILETIPMEGNLQNELQLSETALFVLRDSSIAKLDLASGLLEENWIKRESIASGEFEYPYSLSLDKAEGLLYVGMAHGLGANGSIVVINPFGQKVRKLPVGRFPGQVLIFD